MDKKSLTKDEIKKIIEEYITDNLKVEIETYKSDYYSSDLNIRVCLYLGDVAIYQSSTYESFVQR